MKEQPKTWSLRASLELLPNLVKTEAGHVHLASRLEQVAGVALYEHDCKQCLHDNDLLAEQARCPAHQRIAEIDEALMLEREHVTSLESVIARMVEALNGDDGDDPVALCERRMKEVQRDSPVAKRPPGK